MASQILTSDNVGQFTSNMMEPSLKINGTTHNNTTLLWPQSINQSINQSIKQSIIYLLINQ